MEKELSKVDQQIIDSIIGSSKHEGYVDDGFSRSILEKLAKGEITSEEAEKLVKEHCLNK